jgi:hypothetical protein
LTVPYSQHKTSSAKAKQTPPWSTYQI